MSKPGISLPQLNHALACAQARQEGALERLRCELQFATLLCKLHPDRAAAWLPLVTEACRQVEGVAQAPHGFDLDATVAAAEAILAPLAATAKTYQVYGIGHVHIDMNWMWSWPETVGVVNDTFTTVLRLMEEFPDFHFSQSQAAIYQILEQHHPELLARIAQRVREGRWEVVASHWVEGDKNLAGGESLCRHLLYTRRYMQKLFGLTPEDIPVDWAPDTFGHAATVPTYLAQGGVKYCFLHRPGAHAERWPQAFRWFGPDEASVIVFNGMRGGYNGVFCPRMILGRIESWLTETGLQVAPYMYGVGDHGGGPTRRDLLRYLEVREWPIFPSLRLTTAGAFFAELARHVATLPEVRGELNFAFAGCYTSQSLLKKDNRLGENRLDDAERAAALAQVAAGGSYPAERLEHAWRHILFSQFHDILPGSCVADSRAYSHGLFQQSMATATLEETKALRRLAAAVNTIKGAALNNPAGGEPPPAPGLANTAPPAAEPAAGAAVTMPGAGAGSAPAGVLGAEPLTVLGVPPPMALHSGFSGGAGNGTHNGGLSLADGGSLGGERPFVLFNLDQGERREVVEATIWENARDFTNLPFHRQVFAVSAADGTTCAAQILEKGTYWGHDFVRLAFPVRVPALGYACYVVQELVGDAPVVPAEVAQLGRDDYPARYSFHDLAEEGLENACLRVELDPRSGGIRRLLDKVSGLELITPAQPAPVLEFGIERPHGMSSWAVDHAHSLQALTCTGLKRRDSGPYVVSQEVTFSIRASEFTLTYELRAGDPRLHLKLRGTWREFGSAQVGVPFIRLSLPTNLAAGKLTSEIAFGAVEREFCHGEEVPALQWALLRGRCGGGDAGLLLVNDCKYGHALDGQVLRVNLIRSSYEPDLQPEIGQHEMAFALQPVPADFTVSAATQAGRAFNHPLRVVGTDTHAGTLPASAALLQVEPAELVILAVKKAEDAADALILRLSNPTPGAVVATVKPSPALGRVFRGGAATDLLERESPGAPLLLPAQDGGISLTLPAYGLGTLRLELDGCVTTR